MQNLQESPQKILSTLRIDYKKDILLESRVDPSPLNQFINWFNEAKSTKEIREANAMVISTCSNNMPSSRVVLLKNFDEEGYVFFTNYESQKSKELNENGNIACLFYWDAQERVVRIEGKIYKKKTKNSSAREKVFNKEGKIINSIKYLSSEYSRKYKKKLDLFFHIHIFI